MDIKKLPEAYLNRMRAVLPDEYEEFLSSYEQEPYKGLRFNTKKARADTIERLAYEWKLKPVGWCRDGYYYEGDLRPGLSPYHDAGVYYMQEPSAMLTAEMADIHEEDIVLDLCGAPGGKSTQAAAKCKLLVTNEPVLNRARVLSSNIERMGFDNCIVTSAYPDELENVFTGFFDRIIVDAPCSGEGMMRKDETAIAEWSEDNVFKCIERQKEILSSAAGMLKRGGFLVYSTCTFENGENEEQMYAFLSRNPEFELVKMHRIMPHREKGEGHFCAVLKKKESNRDIGSDGAENASERLCSEKKQEQTINSLAALMKKKHIHVLRFGIEKGELKTGRNGKSYYIPSHAEALAKKYDTDNGAKINILSACVCDSYLSGEAIDTERLGEGDIDLSQAKEGFVTVYYDGYPLGNAKLVKGIIKNHYPKGLRRV